MHTIERKNADRGAGSPGVTSPAPPGLLSEPLPGRQHWKRFGTPPLHKGQTGVRGAVSGDGQLRTWGYDPEGSEGFCDGPLSRVVPVTTYSGVGSVHPILSCRLCNNIC